MKYYKLEYNSLNLKETGTQFQCVSVEKLGDIQKNIFPHEGLIDFSFELPIPIMEKKAKPTTLLNVIPISNRFLVFKDYFVYFLDNFGVKNFQKWAIKVKHNNKYYHDYYLFRFYNSLQKELIDFSRSTFYLGKFSDYLFTGKNFIINNYDEYLKIQNELKGENDNYLKYKKIVLNLQKLNIDMFMLSIDPLAGYYVSEKLKETIEEQRFTGIKFIDINEISNKIEIIY